jgi:hypothetical protein
MVLGHVLVLRHFREHGPRTYLVTCDNPVRLTTLGTWIKHVHLEKGGRFILVYTYMYIQIICMWFKYEKAYSEIN